MRLATDSSVTNQLHTPPDDKNTLRSMQTQRRPQKVRIHSKYLCAADGGTSQQQSTFDHNLAFNRTVRPSWCLEHEKRGHVCGNKHSREGESIVFGMREAISICSNDIKGRGIESFWYEGGDISRRLEGVKCCRHKVKGLS